MIVRGHGNQIEILQAEVQNLRYLLDQKAREAQEWKDSYYRLYAAKQLV